MTLLEMAENSPGFAAFKRRKLTAKVKGHPARFVAANKAFRSKFKAFCKRRGVLSILKENEYSIGDGQTARLMRINGEFVSQINATPSESTRDAA